MDNATTKRSFRLAVAIGAVLLIGLGIARAWELRRSSPPSREPDIQGRVIAQGGPGFLVESPEGSRMWIRPRNGRIQTRNGEPVVFKVGQQVAVWYGPSIRDTFPAQADAEWAIIETESEDPKAQQP